MRAITRIFLSRALLNRAHIVFGCVEARIGVTSIVDVAKLIQIIMGDLLNREYQQWVEAILSTQHVTSHFA